MGKRKGVFISYSKKDAKCLDYLRTHLSYLEREYQFSIWEDSKIKVGADWRSEIEQAIAETKVAILLVSANFIASDFINNEELPALLNAAEKEGAFIFSIIVSHCMFNDIQVISKFQTVNSPSDPLTNMNDGERDALFLKVTQEVKRVLSSDNLNNKKPLNGKKIGELDALKFSFERLAILKTFYENSHENGLSISELLAITKIPKRKIVVQVIHDLEKQELLSKIKINNITYYKLTINGKEFITNCKSTLF